MQIAGPKQKLTGLTLTAAGNANIGVITACQSAIGFMVRLWSDAGAAGCQISGLRVRPAQAPGNADGFKSDYGSTLVFSAGSVTLDIGAGSGALPNNPTYAYIALPTPWLLPTAFITAQTSAGTSITNGVAEVWPIFGGVQNVADFTLPNVSAL